MVNETVTTIIHELRRARDDGQPWHVIARIVRQWAPEASKWTVRSELRLATEREIGISALMLRRYLSTFLQIEGTAKAQGVDISALLPSSFTGAELAVRLMTRSKEAGLQALSDLRERRITIDQVREELEKTPVTETASDRAKAMFDRTDNIEHCEVALAAAASKVFGDALICERRAKLRYFRKIGFEITTAAGHVVGGGDLYLPEASSRSSDPLETIGLSVLLAKYLPSFWVILVEGHPEPVIRRALEVLSVLDHRIGVLLIEDSGNVKILRRAEIRDEALRQQGYAQLIEFFGGRRSQPKHLRAV
ncbi:hypothetical protein AS156_18040 [Bradyrhizobium macuxiense]|uniref:Uncharacterized protein n=1 Tax=Bradyrhizobium macuxiense TaxID=1755647 RepID=A0A109JGF3_9BRAD|nr:hypothetical protein [Bradyrhizobium macuxiense]KWV48384.1 hypothetical protein AS156_18040 [Bradyrhizobium macuxiense]